MAMKKGGLGRGLDALFNENTTDRNELIELNILDIEPNREQPRKVFDQNALEELSNSIKEHGLLQPIVVKPVANGTYRIIAGERRWRACRLAGLKTVPVIVKDFAEQQVMEAALIENLQRQDLNAVEEALGYKVLIDTYGLTQDEVAKRVGKSRVAVTNSLRLLNLNENELELLSSGSITAGHARVILSAEEPVLRKKITEMAINGASVRELEKIARLAKTTPKKATNTIKNAFYSEVELALKQAMHRKVSVQKSGKNHGVISIEFYNDEELKIIAQKLGNKD